MGRQKAWDRDECTHDQSLYGRTWLPDSGDKEYEACDGCGRPTGNTRDA